MTGVEEQSRAQSAEPTPLVTEPPTPLRPASLVVVLNASDRDHFPFSGEGAYRAACPPWASLEFLTDHDIPNALPALLREGDVDGVVFASNALSSSITQKAIADRRFADAWDEDSAADVGVLVLHQYLRPGEMLPVEFLGSASFTLIGRPPRRVDSSEIQFDWAWQFADGATAAESEHRLLVLSRGYGASESSLWTRFQAAYADSWQPLAWTADDETLVAVSGTGDRVVIAGVVPIDWTGAGAHELLGSLLAACLRPRGCLLVEAPTTTGFSAFTTSLASAIDRRRFVHRARPAAGADIDPARAPFCFFDELIVAREWLVHDMSSLDEQAVLRKLEQGGSVVATFDGPADHPVTVRLSGQPQYAQRANHLAAWFLPRIDQFRGDVWCMRGLGEAVAAAREAYEDDRLVPHALRIEFARRHLLEPLRDRVENDNVDGVPLATAGTYAALRALGEATLDGMRAWIGEHLHGEPPSVVAQALTLVPELATHERLEEVRTALAAPTELPGDAALLRAYAAVLFADREPGLVEEAAGDRSLGLGVQAELLRAVARHRIPASKAIVDLAAHVRERVDRLAEGEGALEAICVGNAALIELARRQGIGPSVAVRGRSGQLDARTIENTELVRERAAALEQAEAMRKAGVLAVSVLVALLTLVLVAAIVVILVWFEGNPGAKFGFAAGVFGLMSTLIGYVTKRAANAGIPPWRW